MSKLQTFCEAQGLPWSERAAEAFEGYLALLLKFNKSMNLIGPMDAAEIQAKLFVDSLTSAATYAPSGAILDIGTGAGFPGIPLKIIYPDLPITLVEPRKKRVQFMRIAVNRLGLDDVEIHEARLEELDLAPHDYVISKAFRNPDVWLELAAPLRSDDGVIVAMHGPSPELSDAAAELGLKRIAYTASVRDAFGAHEGEVVRSVSVYDAIG